MRPKTYLPCFFLNTEKKRNMKHLIIVTLALGFLCSTAMAKRVPPSKVNSVTHDKMTYTAPNTDGAIASIHAYDTKTGRKLWQRTIFKVDIDPNLESDVQHVYITLLKVRKGKLFITSEDGKSYTLDLKTRDVKPVEKTKKVFIEP